MPAVGVPLSSAHLPCNVMPAEAGIHGIHLDMPALPVGRFDVTSQIGYNGAVPGRSAGVARMVWDHEVGGSNPLAPTLGM